MWAHVPVLVNEQRKKLSKRRDKVALEQYRDEGYLAEAMVNYLMTLGWAPPATSEIVPWSVIEPEFRLEDVNPLAGLLRPQEARRLQRRVHPHARVDEFIAACEPWLPADYDRQIFAAMAPHVQTRDGHAGRRAPMVDFLMRPTR